MYGYLQQVLDDYTSVDYMLGLFFLSRFVSRSSSNNDKINIHLLVKRFGLISEQRRSSVPSILGAQVTSYSLARAVLRGYEPRYNPLLTRIHSSTSVRPRISQKQSMRDRGRCPLTFNEKKWIHGWTEADVA